MLFSEIISCAAAGELRLGHVSLKTVQILWAGAHSATEYRLVPGGLWIATRMVAMPSV